MADSSCSTIDLLVNRCIQQIQGKKKGLSLSSSSYSSESESDDEQEFLFEGEPPCGPSNYMLNGLRKHMHTIHKFARESIAKCETEECQRRTVTDLQSCLIKLMIRERAFLESFKICTAIVDDVTAEEENEEENREQAIKAAAMKVTESGDHPNYIRLPQIIPGLPSIEELIAAREKMNKMYDERTKSFEDTLTDGKMKQLPRYIAFQEQIALGEAEFRENFKKKMELDKMLNDAEGDDDKILQILLNSNRDRFDIEYPEEVYDDDESVLPSIDPISKKPMMNPVRNIHCHHVFEKSSIEDFINKNATTAKCPLHSCNNQNVLQMKDFLANEEFTMKVRNKNHKTAS